MTSNEVMELQRNNKWDCHKCCDRYGFDIPCSNENKKSYWGWYEGCGLFRNYEELKRKEDFQDWELFDD